MRVQSEERGKKIHPFVTGHFLKDLHKLESDIRDIMGCRLPRGHVLGLALTLLNRLCDNPGEIIGNEMLIRSTNGHHRSLSPEPVRRPAAPPAAPAKKKKRKAPASVRNRADGRRKTA